MAKNKPTPTIPEQILSDHPAEMRALAERLRTLIRQEAPQAIEKAQPSWHSLNYTHPAAGFFCAIFPFDDQVRLGFEWGVLLNDPDNLLEGEGRQVRYLTFHSADQVDPDTVAAFISQALALPGSRDERLWLMENKKHLDPPEA